MSSGYHTRWVVPPEHRESPEYRAAGRRMEFAQAVYDRRTALGWTEEVLAQRSGLSVDEIESIEESGTDPTLDLVEQLARAFEAVAQMSLGEVLHLRFDARAA